MCAVNSGINLLAKGPLQQIWNMQAVICSLKSFPRLPRSSNQPVQEPSSTRKFICDLKATFICETCWLFFFWTILQRAAKSSCTVEVSVEVDCLICGGGTDSAFRGLQSVLGHSYCRAYLVSKVVSVLLYKSFHFAFFFNRTKTSRRCVSPPFRSISSTDTWWTGS